MVMSGTNNDLPITRFHSHVCRQRVVFIARIMTHNHLSLRLLSQLVINSTQTNVSISETPYLVEIMQIFRIYNKNIFKSVYFTRNIFVIMDFFPASCVQIDLKEVRYDLIFFSLRCIERQLKSYPLKTCRHMREALFTGDITAHNKGQR